MKYDFLTKRQKEVLNAVEMIIEECGDICLGCRGCEAYSDDPYTEGCIFENYPHSYFIGGVDGYSNITDAARTLMEYCNDGDYNHCLFTTDDCDSCILKGCPALWEKRLQLLKSKEEDE